MATKKGNETGNAVEKISKKELIAGVGDSLKALQAEGKITFPKNYNPQNALISAGLILTRITGKDDVPVLQCCTKASIQEALLTMCKQGLNPDKNQCYFIPYGNKLQLQTSYMGKMAIAKSVRPDIKEIIATVVWSGDAFEYKIERGRKIVTKHEQKIENCDSDKFIAVYCEIIGMDDNIIHTEIMTEKEVLASWSMSKMKTNGAREKFTGEMVKKSVIGRACKYIINTSDDSNLVAQSFKSNQAENEAEAFEVETAEKENAIEVEIEPVEEPKKISDLPKTTGDDTDSKEETKAGATKKKAPF